MARHVRNNFSNSGGTHVTNFTPTTVTHVSGDVLLVYATQINVNATLSTATTGWTKETQTNYNNDMTLALFWKVASSSSETMPQIDSTGTEAMTATVVVLDGVDNTDVIEISGVNDSTGERQSPTTVTPTNGNCLVLYYGISDKDFREIGYLPPAVGVLSNNDDDETSVAMAWFTHTPASTVTPTHYTVADFASTRVLSITVAINTASGEQEPCVDPSSTPADLFLVLSRSDDYLCSGFSDPTASILPTINGNSTVYKLPTSRVMIETQSCEMRAIALNGPTGDTESIAAVGRTSSMDLSSSLISVACWMDAGARALNPYDDGGRYFGFSDGTNAEVWKVESKDSVVSSPGGGFAVVIDTDTTPFQANGTINWAAIDRLIIGFNGQPGVTTSPLWSFCWKLGILKLIGGSSSRPCSFTTAYSVYETGRLYTVFNHKGYTDSQYTATQKIQIGNGTYATYWKSTGQSIAFPPAYNVADRNIRVNITSGVIGLDIYAISGDTINFSSTTIDGGDFHYFSMNASTHNSDIYNFTSCLVLSATVTLRSLSNVDLSGLTFSECKEITHNGALLNGVSINSCVDAQAVTVTSEAAYGNLAGATFKNNTTAILITGNQSHTGAGWADAGLTVSGNTYDIEYSGATNFSIQSAASLTVNNSGAGTLTIVTPTTDIIINSSESSTLIQIFETTTQTVVDSTTGSSLTYTYTGTPTYDLVIQKAGFLPQRFVGESFAGTSVTYNITLVADPVYDSAHGLTYTTDASWASNQLTVPTFGPSVRGVYSLMIDSFISQTALRNTAFNIQMNGPNAMFLKEGAEGASDASIENMTAGGVRYLSVADAITAEWVGIESIGTIPGGATGEYQQVDGSDTTDARTTGKFDEIIKVYGDASHGNFDYTGHLVLKYQINGYREKRVDVLDTYGISALEAGHYIVAMAPVAITAATGDPALTIVITDHGASPVSWNGKNFAITVTDSATPSTGENILREINYNLSLDATYQSKDPFNWPEMLLEEGDAYATVYGYTEGAQSSTLKGVRVVKNDGTTAHPDFTRFQSDDGTYYTPAVVSQISITGMPTAGANIRLQIHNDTAKTASAWGATTAYSLGDKVLRSTGLGTEQTAGLYMVCTTAGTSGGSEPTWDTTVGNTTVDGTVTWTTYAILFYDADPASASYSDSYTDGEQFIDGDTYRIRFAEMNGATSFKTFETTGLVGATGFTLVVTTITDSVYGTNALDGSGATITNKFTADYVNDQIDLDTNSDFAGTEAYAYYCYEITTSSGMYQFWGGITAIDVSNYRINASIADIYFDETAGFVKQTDSVRIFRDDGLRPAIDPTTGGNGIELNWKNPVYTYATGGSALTAAESAKLLGLNDFDAATETVIANIKYVNDITVTGDGETGTEWGPA